LLFSLVLVSGFSLLVFRFSDQTPDIFPPAAFYAASKIACRAERCPEPVRQSVGQESGSSSSKECGTQLP